MKKVNQILNEIKDRIDPETVWFFFGTIYGTVITIFFMEVV
jgi:hypothetical protein